MEISKRIGLILILDSFQVFRGGIARILEFENISIGKNKIIAGYLDNTYRYIHQLGNLKKLLYASQILSFLAMTSEALQE